MRQIPLMRFIIANFLLLLGLTMTMPVVARDGCPTAANEMRCLITQLYVGTLARAPSNAELENWTKQITTAGWDETTLAQEFYNNSANQTELATMYPAARLYQNGNLHGVFVTSLYQTMFGRDADGEGYAYWLNDLTHGNKTHDQMIIAFINGGHANAAAAQDMRRFDALVEVGLAFADYQLQNGIVPSAANQTALRQVSIDILKYVTANPDETTIVDTAIAIKIPELLSRYVFSHSDWLNADGVVLSETEAWSAGAGTVYSPNITNPNMVMYDGLDSYVYYPDCAGFSRLIKNYGTCRTTGTMQGNGIIYVQRLPAFGRGNDYPGTPSWVRFVSNLQGGTHRTFEFSISTTPGDFTHVADGCYKQSTSSDTYFYNSAGSCPLNEGTVYYANIRAIENASTLTCGAAGNSPCVCSTQNPCRLEVNAWPYPDRDMDGIKELNGNPNDNCPETPNPLQSDADSDGIGDVCDTD